jgi:hypothetical protein
VAKVRERLTVNQQLSKRFHMEEKKNGVEGKENYCVEVSNRCELWKI